MIEFENLARSNKKFQNDVETSMRRVLQSGVYILNQEVAAFESEFASYLGVPHCIGVASGLDALILSLAALDLPNDAEVLVPSNTYIATILAIVRLGLKPVLVEPSLSTYNIDPHELEKKITSKSKAVLVVHLYGRPCEMDSLLRICEEKKLYLIEDCAQAHGASYKGKKVGTFGIGAFSFYPTKNLGGYGDGGCITCDDKEFAEKIRRLRNYGSSQKYNNSEIGWNSRLDEIQAAALRIKLKHLDELNRHKNELAQIYIQELPDFVIQPAPLKEFEISCWHIFNIRIQQRDQLKHFLLQKHLIKTEIHYPICPHEQSGYQHIFRDQRYPLSEEIHKTTLSLPIAYMHSKEDIMKVCGAIRQFAKEIQ